MDKTEDKLVAYFNGFLSEEDGLVIEKWSEASAGNKKVFDTVKAVYDSTFVEDSNFVPDVDAAWNAVSNKIEKESKVIKLDFTIVTKVAAVILMVIGIGYVSIFQFNDSKQLSVKTGFGQTQEILLPDGTHVILNENSVLSYPEFFDKNKRNVALVGQAFFDVKKNKRAAFIIKGRNSTISVLGTAFDVLAQEKYSEINVLRGSVRVSSNTNKENVTLIKDQRVIVESDKLTTFESLDQNSLAWRSNELDFESATLNEVSKILSSHFDVIVLVDENIKTCRITSKMNDMSLEEILEVLDLIANVKSSISEGKVTLSGPSC